MPVFTNKKFNRNHYYISFVDQEGRLRSEFIPNDNRIELQIWLTEKLTYFLWRINLPVHYGQFRFRLDAETRKQEDLAFLIHVYTQHDGKPEIGHERRLYKRLMNKYDIEFNQFILPKLYLEKEKIPVTHPYARVYYRRWLVKTDDPDWVKVYHGMDRWEHIEMLEIIVKKIGNAMKYKKNTYYYEHKKLTGKDKTKKRNKTTKSKS